MSASWINEGRACRREGILQLQELGILKVPYVVQAATMDPRYYLSLVNNSMASNWSKYP
jgi:hypothetical protein